MPTITYTFTGAPEAKLASLIFEQTNNAKLKPGKNNGSIDCTIYEYLDIDIIVTGNTGAEWSLYVEVDSKPIGEPSVGGIISGKISKGYTSHSKNAYNW